MFESTMRSSLVNAPFNCLRILGHLHYKTTAKIAIQLILAVIFLTYVVILADIQYYYIENVVDLIDNVETSVNFQIWCKLLFCIYYKNKILNLIETSQKFWDWNKCTKSAQVEVTNLLKTISFLQKGFLYLTSVTVLVVVIPFSILRKRLPVGIWKLGDNQMFHVTWWFCACTDVYSVFFVYGFEGLFIGLIWEVMAQFKILCDHLEQLNVENIHTNADLEEHYKKFVLYIEHHKFLMRFIEDLKNCYSLAFFFHFLATAPVICSELYAIFESSTLSLILQHCITLTTLIVQCAVYCIPADYLAKETLTVAHGIYNSNWYGKHFKKLGQSVQLMIQEAQREVRITSLGGLLNINCQTLLSVLRISFSICTILRNLKK